MFGAVSSSFVLISKLLKEKDGTGNTIFVTIVKVMEEEEATTVLLIKSCR